jgi:ribonuclease P protein component
MIKFKSLNQSKQFLRILKKKRLNTKYFTIYFEKNSSSVKNNDKKILNVSFVMKKNIGNAVIRNKIKRKLKSAVQKVLKEKQSVDSNYTYVIFGRNNVYKDKFQLIFDEVNDMFKRIKQITS